MSHSLSTVDTTIFQLYHPLPLPIKLLEVEWDVLVMHSSSSEIELKKIDSQQSDLVLRAISVSLFPALFLFVSIRCIKLYV